MIYPENFESKIGFDRICNQIAVLCITDGAREKLSGLHFSTSREEIVRLLEETFEMRTILMLESDFPESNYVDTALFLKKAEVTGAFLETGEILTLRKGLTAAYELVRFFGSDSGAKYPRLRALSRDVQGFPEIINHIDSIIDRFGKVKDSASPGTLHRPPLYPRAGRTDFAPPATDHVAGTGRPGWSMPMHRFRSVKDVP